MHRLAAVLPFCVLAAAVVRAQETLVSDNITLGAAVAVEDPQAIAGEVTAEYGGTLVEPLEGVRSQIDPVTQNLVVQQLRAVYATVYGDDELQRATRKDQ